MPKEYELRFMNYNKKDLIHKLKKLGAKLIHKAIIYEYMVFHHPLKQTDVYIRVRKEFDKITLTYKTNLKSKYVDEYEINVSDYDQTIQILNMLGLKKKYQIQKLREKWLIETRSSNFAEIVFDTYPGIPEYMEVECNSLKFLKQTISKLGLVEEKLFHAGTIYDGLYDMDPRRKKEGDLTFHTVKKVIKPYIRKNIKIFNQIIKLQQLIVKNLN